jgi:Tfp pilus assembly protein PilV
MVLLSVGVLGLQALSVTAIRANAQARTQTVQSAALSEVMETAIFSLRFGADADDITPGTSCSSGDLGETCVTVAEVTALSSVTQRVFSVVSTLTPQDGGNPVTLSSVIYVPVAPGGGSDPGGSQ